MNIYIAICSENTQKVDKQRFQFDRNLPYNQLPLLPPPEEIIDHEVLTKWGYASRALAKLSANILHLPNPDMLINTISLQEAKSSSEIENIFTTHKELYKAISDTVKEDAATPPPKKFCVTERPCGQILLISWEKGKRILI